MKTTYQIQLAHIVTTVSYTAWHVRTVSVQTKEGKQTAQLHVNVAWKGVRLLVKKHVNVVIKDVRLLVKKHVNVA